MFEAHYILDGGDNPPKHSVSGFFYAQSFTIRGFIPPCKPVIGLLPSRCNATGKVKPFFIHLRQTNISAMHYADDNGLNGKTTPNQTRDNAPYALKTPSYLFVQDEAKTPEGLLQLKHDLSDVFMTFLLLYDHGAELGNGDDYSFRIYNLYMLTQSLLDSIALTENQK